jgi:hypothetical protein
MNLTDALHVWRRRWILTLVLLLLAVGATVGAAMKLPKHYTAESDVVLLPSTSSSAVDGHNPYLAFNGSLPMTAQIIAYQLLNPSTLESLAAQGYTENFTVALAPTAGGAPILDVVVSGSNKAAVESTLNGVTNEIAGKLSALQTGIGSDNQITAMTLSVAKQPSLSLSKSARPLVLLLVFGLAITFAVPLIIDGAARRRVSDASSVPDDRARLPVGLADDGALSGGSRQSRRAAQSLPRTGSSVGQTRFGPGS